LLLLYFVPLAPMLTSSPAINVASSTVTGVYTESGGLLPGMHRLILGAESVMDTFSQLLKAQTDVMTAQVKAAAVQSLPSLSHYSSEGSDITDDEFDRWVKRFLERAKLAHWTEEEQHYQLKLHLLTSPLWLCSGCYLVTSIRLLRVLSCSEKIVPTCRY